VTTGGKGKTWTPGGRRKSRDSLCHYVFFNQMYPSESSEDRPLHSEKKKPAGSEKESENSSRAGEKRSYSRRIEILGRWEAWCVRRVRIHSAFGCAAKDERETFLSQGRRERVESRVGRKRKMLHLFIRGHVRGGTAETRAPYQGEKGGAQGGSLSIYHKKKKGGDGEQKGSIRFRAEQRG